MQLKKTIGLVVLLFLLAGCIDSTDSDESSKEEPIESPGEARIFGEIAWTDITEGLPEGFGVRDSAQRGDHFYLLTNRPSALYRWDSLNPEAGWEKVTEFSGYPNTRLAVVNDQIFIGGHGGSVSLLLDELEPSEEGRVPLFRLPPINDDTNLGGLIVAGKNRLLSRCHNNSSECRHNPVIKYFDLNQLPNKSHAELAGLSDEEREQLNLTWTDTEFNKYIPDAKPHIQLFEFQGDIWFKTNYSNTDTKGTWRYRNNQWQKVMDLSPALSVTGDDQTLYVSFEETPTTQISSIFKYVEDDPQHPNAISNLQQIYADREGNDRSLIDGWLVPLHSHRGYGIGSVPFEGSKNVFMGGRFGAFILDGPKKWLLPGYTADLGLIGNEGIRVQTRHTQVVNGIIFTQQSYRRDGEDYNRILMYQPDLDELPYYTSNVDVQVAKLIDNTLSFTESTITDDEGKEKQVRVWEADMNLRWAGSSTLVASLTTEKPFTGEQEVSLESDFTKGDFSGVLLRLNDQGAIQQAFRFNQRIRDLETAVIGGIAYAFMALESGFVLFDVNNGQVISQLQEAGARSVDITDEGYLGTVSRSGGGRYQVSYYTSLNSFKSASPAWTQERRRSYVEDLAVVPQAASNQGRVYLVGFDNKRLPGGNPVQVAFLEALDLTTGEFDDDRYRFGFDGADLSNNIADTRLYNVRFGPDGKLYITGESAGSKTIFRYDGQVYEGPENLAKTDHYNDLWNTASAHMSYVAQVDVDSGDLLQGKLVMSRLSGGRSNTFRVRDLAVGREQIFLPASAAAHIANRRAQTLNGQPIGPYAGGDPSLLALSTQGLEHRLAWTAFTHTLTQGDLRAADLSPTGQLAVWGYVNANTGSSSHETPKAFTKAWNAEPSSTELKGEQRLPYLLLLDSETGL